MANAPARITIVTMQADNAGAGNGTAADTTGARAVIVFLDAGGTPGTVEMEYSVDGENWSSLPMFDTDGEEIDSTLTENLIAFAQVFPGPSQIRARVPSAWTGGAPKAQAVIVR